MICQFYLKEWKLKKLVANLHDKTEHVIHIRTSKQALNHGLVLKNIYRVIKFHQNSFLKRPFLSSRIMESSGKLWKIWDNKEI